MKNSNGYVVEVAGFWNEYIIYHLLKYNGQNLYVITNYWKDITGSRTVILTISEGEVKEYFGYTITPDWSAFAYGEAAINNGNNRPISGEIFEENGVEYIDFLWYKEKYLGLHKFNHYSTSDHSINTYDDLMLRIDEINSYPYVEFNLEA